MGDNPQPKPQLKSKPKKKIVGLPLSEDYQEGGIKYDPSQLAPSKKKK